MFTRPRVRLPTALLTLLLPALLCHCGGTETSQLESAAERPRDLACQQSCAISVKADCPNIGTNCVAECEIALASPCGAHFAALAECASTVTVEDYQCSETGTSMLRPEVCERQLAPLMQCLKEAA